MSSKVFFLAILAAILSALRVTNRVQFLSPASHIIAKSSCDMFSKMERVPIEGAIGPESFEFDPLGAGPYTGVSDGRIIKWHEIERRWIDFSITSPQREGCEGLHNHEKMEHICGRPLGMRFYRSTGDLYIADAYMGILKVGPEGGLATRIATEARGVAFGFTNSLDIDQASGAVYFTDSSSIYERRNYIGSILSGDKTGRLMKYDFETNQVTVLLNNMSFPNGVALSKDGNYILIAETTKCRVLKYWLKTPKAGTLEVFAQLQGFVDNIKTSPREGFWVGMHSKREKIVEWLISHPWIGNALLRLPINLMKAHASLAKYRGSGLAVRLSEDGDIVETFVDISGLGLGSISEVEERDGSLWVGSVTTPFAGRFKL
ncbi:Str_synth domain-containing protein, partial [Cephalotus follicularis]